MSDWLDRTDPAPDDPPLAGVRVLDLSRILAGPWATMTLADLGADVLKIERPGTGDDTRHWGPPWIDGGGERTASYFHCANRNKRSLAIDLATPRGAERVRSLAAGADVVVENYPLRPSSDGPVHSLAKHGLDPASLRARAPSLVVCSITGYGHTGPRATEPGYDAMMQGMSGHMSVTGEAGGPPLKIGVALMDVLTGLTAANAIQAALFRALRTGRGDHIDLALFDVAVQCLANQATGALASGRDPGRLGTAHPSIVPYQGFACADGHVMLAVGNDGQHARLCELLGAPELAADAYVTNAGRVAARETLVPALQTLIERWERAAFLAGCAERGVPAGPVNTIRQALADPQGRARGLVLDLDGAPGIRSPFRFADARTAQPTRAPGLGADG